MHEDQSLGRNVTQTGANISQEPVAPSFRLSPTL